MRKLSTYVLLLALLGLAPSTVASSDDRPPPARLIFRDRGQTGLRGTYCWAFDGGIGCADAAWDFPDRELRVEPGRMARIRIRHPAAIEHASLHGWRRVSDQPYGEEPVGDGRRFRVRIEPNRSDGRITGWRIPFRLPDREGRLYLGLFVRWAEEGDAEYTFSLEMRER